MFTLISRVLVISETFPTGLAKGNKAGVQRNIKQKNVSLSCSVTPVIRGLDELCTSDASDLHLTICSRNVVVLHEQILRLTLQGQFKILKTFHLNSKHVLPLVLCPFRKSCPNIDYASDIQLRFYWTVLWCNILAIQRYYKAKNILCKYTNRH